MTTPAHGAVGEARVGNRSSFAIALGFAKAGVRIIPVKVFREDDRWRKRPHIKEWPRRASADPSVIEDWWMEFPEAVPGIVLEHYGRVVVDCDRHGGPDGVAAFAALGPFPPHPIVRSAGGGEHHYFLQTDPPLRGTLVPVEGIEVMGVGRFVVAPGAGGYELVSDVAVTPELPEVFKVKAKVNRSAPDHSLEREAHGVGSVDGQSVGFEPTRDFFGRMKAIVSWLERAKSGERTHTLFKAACMMAKMTTAEGKPKPSVAEQLLMNGCWVNGLVKDYGKATCRATIAAAYRHIEKDIDHTLTRASHSRRIAKGG
jgi:hypothetical protein